MLTQAGTMVLEVWRTLPDSFVNVTLDSFVVMPNHLHFIIWLGTPLDRSEDNEKSKQSSEADNSVQPSLPEIMQWFKSLTTAKYRHGVNTLDWPAFPGKLWQRSYYDHIVRSDEALYAIRSYIHSNPQRWLCDRYHPQPFGRDDDAIALWQLLKSEEPPR
jgi:REP element-mobilizing transposase RayT